MNPRPTTKAFPLDPVLASLRLERPRSVDVAWLAEAFRAWTRVVPFTNLGKLKAIRAGEPLPSLDPGCMMERFLEDGSCGTCFSHALAFRALLCSVGYDARIYAGHTTGEDGVRGEHATTLVMLGRDTWLVDTALPHGKPLQLFRDRPARIENVMTPMTASPAGDLWKLDFILLHNNTQRQAVLTEELRDTAHAMQCWVRTLEEADSPFNKVPVARLESELGFLTLAGNKLFVFEYEHGIRVEPAGPETLARFGIEPTSYAGLWSTF